MFVYQAAISTILLVLLVNFILSNIYFKDIKRFTLPPELDKKRPLVPVLVPARDEEGHIGRCIHSLRKQNYPHIEILVLDDQSRDTTALEVENIAKQDPRVRLIAGKVLPSGRVGKPHACWQLAQQAKGQYLLFTDADTLDFNQSVSCVLAALIRE